jgi:hypothetical protein
MEGKCSDRYQGLSKEDRILQAILDHPTNEKAAVAAGVSTTTIWRYLKKPRFQERLRQAQRDSLSRCYARLVHSAPAAVWVLNKAMSNPNEQTRSKIHAANTILKHTEAAAQREDFADRLDRVEKLVLGKTLKDKK